MFKPFENGNESSNIEDLTLENQVDRVSLYGNLQITKDQHGLTLAKKLQTFLNTIVTELEKQPLPEKIQIKTEEEIDNPFL
ncbi:MULTISPECIES: hypothetical protein [unclassified Acinetobacter]|uniref:hypothetical protein n=1 Tax=unclassified Acinetobacter TaxID=196816 RepID=UPI0019090C6C|nr:MULTISPECIES: hypothetical protein [unclassified Acinetobacter]MBK0063436.1 hypothetical protein [Acinetobacter sp. S55]MBK0065493.1 hypothetical protein [Acinetobacter sp. S54]